MRGNALFRRETDISPRNFVFDATRAFAERILSVFSHYSIFSVFIKIFLSIFLILLKKKNTKLH